MCGRLRAVTRDAQRFEIFEMVQAGKRAMRSERLHAVIDLEPVLRPARAPRPRGRLVRGLGGKARARRTLRRDVSAPAAAVLVALLGRRARARPPVIVPERVVAAVAAPRPPARGQRGAAPRAAARPRLRERAGGQQRGALGCRYGASAGSRVTFNCGERRPSRKSPSAAVANCIPVQKRPNSPNRDDASSKRISYTSFLNVSGSSA